MVAPHSAQNFPAGTLAEHLGQAMAPPAAFQRLGKDPAFGSGPLATVFQDLFSIAVYLAIAVAIVV